jgi:integral membrane protein (TIGR01906 family)
VRRFWSVVTGLALAVLVLGVALALLTQPFFTRTLSGRFSLASEAGLPRERMLDVAEQVRAFVVDRESSALPDIVDDRPGFDAPSVSHLADVRRVIAGARLLTWALAIALAIMLAVAVVRRRFDRIAAALRAGALWCTVFVLLTVVAGLLDFDALFSSFHGVFFAEGTWTFAPDSLLIQTFPETFWATAAAVWAGLVLLGAVLLALGARAVRASLAAPSKSRGPAS